jgi:lipoprotein-anchoring transpeptidase ErfK/SrfK
MEPNDRMRVGGPGGWFEREGQGGMRRVKSILTVAFAVTGATTATAAAHAAAKAGTPASAKAATKTPAPDHFAWNDPGTAEPVTVVISIPLQHAYVFRGQLLVAATAVSTGKKGSETPTGIYPVLQKAAAHRSNLYDASMPFMQRLTWDGIALHAGPNPGFPASHGCIRLPQAFAKRLFAVTGLGTKVVVTDGPVDGTLDPALLGSGEPRLAYPEIALLGD